MADYCIQWQSGKVGLFHTEGGLNMQMCRECVPHNYADLCNNNLQINRVNLSFPGNEQLVVFILNI